MGRALLVGVLFLTIIATIGFVRIWWLQGGEVWYADDLARMGINPTLAPLAPVYLSFRSGSENVAYLMQVIPKEFDYFRGGLFWRTLSVLWVRHQQLSASYLGETVFGNDPYIFGPVGATTIGTFWAEGGYVGIVLGFTIIGYALEWLYIRMTRVDTIFWRLCYTSMLVTCLIYIYGTFFGEINILMRLFFLSVLSLASANIKVREWSPSLSSASTLET